MEEDEKAIAKRCCEAQIARSGLLPALGRSGLDVLVGESHWELAADESASKSRPVRLADN